MFVEVKNTIAIDSIPIIIVVDDDMGMEPLVELAMGIPDIVLVGEPDADMVILMPLMLEPLIGIMLLSMTVISLLKEKGLRTGEAQI